VILRPDPFLRWFEPIRNLRRQRAPGYVTAVAGVAVATAVRSLFSSLLAPVTFTTFHPVVALATLVGGARAGFLALALSAVAANLLIMKPRFTFSLGAPALVSTGLFIIVGVSLVVLMDLLNQAVDRISAQAETTERILKVQPVGVLLVDAEGIINFVNSRIEKDFGYSRDELRGQVVEMLESDGRSFTFVWQERGGPEVVPPTRRGFGSTILQDLARGFASGVYMDYAPDGFRYELRAELTRIFEADGVLGQHCSAGLKPSPGQASIV
jgi:PAS domain-containing protein